MGQVLARILMWVIIIAAVGYFAQQWKDGTPSGKEQEALLDAARSYHEYKAQLEQAQGGRESDVPQIQLGTPGLRPAREPLDRRID